MENLVITSLRLKKSTLKDIDEFAEEENLDRSTVLKQAVAIGLNDLKLEKALAKYIKGGISAGKAASLAGISLWDFIDLLKERNIGFKTDEKEILRQIKTLVK